MIETSEGSLAGGCCANSSRAKTGSGTVAGCCVKGNSKDANVEVGGRLSETFSVFKVSKGVYS